MRANWLIVVLLAGCGGSSQVYLHDTDQPLHEPGERVTSLPTKPPRRAKKRGGGPAMYSLHVENSCPDEVRLYLGRERDDPDGSEMVLGPGETTSKSGFVPATLFLLEAPAGEAVEYVAEAGSQTVVVGRSCAEIVKTE